MAACRLFTAGDRNGAGNVAPRETALPAAGAGRIDCALVATLSRLRDEHYVRCADDVPVAVGGGAVVRRPRAKQPLAAGNGRTLGCSRQPHEILRYLPAPAAGPLHDSQTRSI